MGEALITRRGGGGGVKTGIANQASDSKTLKITALVGVKNAIVSVNTKVNMGYHSDKRVLMLELRDGEVYKVLCANSSGDAMDRATYITFNSSTGTFTSKDAEWIRFNTTTDNCYEYIIFD